MSIPLSIAACLREAMFQTAGEPSGGGQASCSRQHHGHPWAGYPPNHRRDRGGRSRVVECAIRRELCSGQLPSYQAEYREFCVGCGRFPCRLMRKVSILVEVRPIGLTPRSPRVKSGSGQAVVRQERSSRDSGLPATGWRSPGQRFLGQGPARTGQLEPVCPAQGTLYSAHGEDLPSGPHASALPP